jgi:hypothetical protein
MRSFIPGTFLLFSPGGKQYGVHDHCVAGAAAEVSGHGCPDLVLVGLRRIPEQGKGDNDHGRCAESALHGPGIAKGLGQNRKARCISEPLDGNDPPSVHSPQGHQAGEGRAIVQQDRTSAALPLATADLGSCQIEFIPKYFRQPRTRPCIGANRTTVQCE